MYKLLIIDDEPIIRQGLRTIIDWLSFDIEICGEADNGAEGARLCIELQPDIAIVDVKMPVMDGIQMIEEVRKAGGETDFIVLSGYSEFGYAQRAIEQGVNSYLLKPIEQEDLSAKVVQLHKIWSRKMSSRQSLNELRSLKLEKAMQRIVTREAGTTLQNEDMVLLTTHLGLPWTYYQVILLSDERRDLEPEEKEWLILKLRETYDSERTGITFNIGTYVGVLSNREHSDENDYDWIPQAKERFGVELVLAVGSAAVDIDGVADSYYQARFLIKNKFMNSRCGIAVMPGITSFDTCAASIEDAASFERIRDLLAKGIEAGNKQMISQLLRTAGALLLRQDWSENQIKAAFSALYVDAMNALAMKHGQEKPTSAEMTEKISGIDAQYSLERLVSYLEGCLHACCEAWKKEKTNDSFQPILDFISAHYREDIKLEFLAQLFNYNSSYLGKLFKSQTGLSFNAYLDDIRMQEAKRLLINGSKVYEVAEIVGYANVDYFHLKFKKSVGVSPSSYREKGKAL
ncbi:response regulator transcription factor [Paenibacillus frigoriresistens]|uniref:response regulator n=1 Tax=Paenibacillus alginolyticus TaxID=59839 RepID=UPI001562EF9B|nr:response regulator [Paenibacillus frigoriresistens]NRF95305.1 response regulator transcription factor [Paenibacillus frigoriresistens]